MRPRQIAAPQRLIAVAMCGNGRSNSPKRPDSREGGEILGVCARNRRSHRDLRRIARGEKIAEPILARRDRTFRLANQIEKERVPVARSLRRRVTRRADYTA